MLSVISRASAGVGARCLAGSFQVLRVQFNAGITDYSVDELEELMLAYALSVHESQGSEYRCVLVPVAWEHYIMLNERLLYTAISRGRERAVLVGQRKALRVSVSRSPGVQRLTALHRRLLEAFDPSGREAGKS